MEEDEIEDIMQDIVAEDEDGNQVAARIKMNEKDPMFHTGSDVDFKKRIQTMQEEIKNAIKENAQSIMDQNVTMMNSEIKMTMNRFRIAISIFAASSIGLLVWFKPTMDNILRTIVSIGIVFISTMAVEEFLLFKNKTLKK